MSAVTSFLTLAALVCDEPTILEMERSHAREHVVPSRPDLVAWIGPDLAVEFVAYVQTLGCQITWTADEELMQTIGPALARVIEEKPEIEELWPSGRA